MGNKYLLTLSAAIFGLVFSSFAQDAGDYRSAATGDWNSTSTWEVFDGATWNSATTTPGGTNESDADNVYLEAGFTVTLTQEESVGDIHFNGTQDVIRLNTNNFDLNVWGRLRTYSGTAPGTTEGGGSGSGVAGWLNTGTTGSLKIRGTVDRTFVEAGAMTGNSRAAGWTMDFAFDPGVTGTVAKTMRCGHLIVSSGILNTGIEQIRVAADDYTGQPGNGVSGGTVLVKSGAHLMSASLHKNNATSIGNSLASFTLEAGAELTPTVPGMNVSALTYDLSGTVNLTQGSFIEDGFKFDAVPITDYSTVTHSGTAAAMPNDVTISDSLILMALETIDTNGFTLTYGAGASLVYRGTVTQLATDNEFKNVGGAENVIIDNASNVRIKDDKTISGSLTINQGVLSLESATLTIADAATINVASPSASSMIALDAASSIELEFTGAGTNMAPIGEIVTSAEYSPVTILANSASNFGAGQTVTISVTDAEHAANSSANSAISRYWGISTSLTDFSIDVVAQYDDADVSASEANLAGFIFDSESAGAANTIGGTVDTAANTITWAGLSELGFITAADRCDLADNTISLVGNVDHCGSKDETVTFNGSAVSASGAVTYRWLMNTDGGTFSAIDGENAQNYVFDDTVGAGVYAVLREAYDSANCISPIVSDTGVVNVLSNISGNAITTAGAAYCTEISTEPINANTPTGGNGSYTYSWLSTLKTSGTYSEFDSGSNSTELSSTAAGDTVLVKLAVGSGVCADTTDAIELAIIPTLSGGAIGNDQTINQGDSPETLVETSALAGGTGVYSYQWLSSTTAGGPFSVITDSIGSTLSPGALNDTTWYVRESTSGPCMVADTVVINVDVVNDVVDPTAISLQVYPNPVVSSFSVASDMEVLGVEILSSEGTSLLHVKGNVVGSEVETLVPGMYLLKVQFINGNESLVPFVKN